MNAMTGFSVTIERGVPLPQNAGRESIYPFAQMQVGDSFAIPDGMDTKVRAAASAHGRRYSGRRFSIRNTSNGFRCWRVS